MVAAAISDQPRPLRIHTCVTNSGGNRVTGFSGRSDLPSLQDNIVVPAMTLEKILEHFKVDVCDLLKIDVEGYELNVLRSAAKALMPAHFPLVVLEYGPEGCRAAGVSGWEIVSYMLQRGYKCDDLHTGQAIKSAADIPNISDFSVTDFIFDAR